MAKLAMATLADPPKLDLDAYIRNYQGRTRFNRLYHIGTTSSYLATEALKQAVLEAKNAPNVLKAKKGADVARYQKAVAALARVAPNEPEAQLEQDWVDRIELEVKRETIRLEQELKDYKNNLIKESIRMGYGELGSYYYNTGNQVEAAKAFQKERDFCQLPIHVVQMNLQLIKVHIDQGAWHHVQINAQRLHHMGARPADDETEPKLNAVLGLAALASRQYAQAADYFLDVDPIMLNSKADDKENEDALNAILTTNDIATYGALCALASFDRAALQSRVLENPKFRPFLELEPHLRRAISAFVSGRYSTTLSTLASYRTDYLLDLHLYAHLDQLYLSVRSKALVEYFQPFSSIQFATLGAAFGANENEVVAMSVGLIKTKQLEARLDLDHGLLVANDVNKRRNVQENALKMAREYERAAKQKLIRLEALSAGLEVRAGSRIAGLPGSMDLDDNMFDGPSQGLEAAPSRKAAKAGRR